MPIELESGNLQLTSEEVVLYRPAAALVAKALKESISLHKPITRLQFAMLILAHSVVTGDDEMLNNIAAVAESEIAKRKRPH